MFLFSSPGGCDKHSVWIWHSSQTSKKPPFDQIPSFLHSTIFKVFSYDCVWSWYFWRMLLLTGLGAEGLHQREGLRATVWEVAAGQPHPGGRDLHRSRTAAGELSLSTISDMRRWISDVAFFICSVWSSSTDLWDMSGPELSERHRSRAGELVRPPSLLWSLPLHCVVNSHVDSHSCPFEAHFNATLYAYL